MTVPSSAAHELRLKKVRREETGEYSCSAANGVGSELVSHFKVSIWSMMISHSRCFPVAHALSSCPPLGSW